MSWSDFNTAEDFNSFGIIPKNTLAKVKMIIKPGGYNDPEKGWTGGYATRNQNSGAVYLNVEFIIMSGEYAKRKIFGKIGLYSEKGEQWGNMGRSFIKSALNSARGIGSKDVSEHAKEARKISSISDIDGLEFIALIDVEKDQSENDRNIIKVAVTNEHKDYDALMRGASSQSSYIAQKQPSVRPAWAQ